MQQECNIHIYHNLTILQTFSTLFLRFDNFFKAFKQLQESASDFERANEKYNSAKGKVAESEKKMMNEGRVFDGALQELLNHATVEVSTILLACKH
jgi:hypothetical protein